MGRVLTVFLVSVTCRSVGRKKKWSQDMQARFPEGTFERIHAVLISGEDRTDFVRMAVESELQRRERQANPSIPTLPRTPRTP
jgi:hypothetical protein